MISTYDILDRILVWSLTSSRASSRVSHYQVLIPQVWTDKVLREYTKTWDPSKLLKRSHDLTGTHHG